VFVAVSHSIRVELASGTIVVRLGCHVGRSGSVFMPISDARGTRAAPCPHVGGREDTRAYRGVLRIDTIVSSLLVGLVGDDAT
jgi:hypothetical protein